MFESINRQNRQMEIEMRMCTVVQQMCQCMLFCINAFIILLAWADVIQGLSACNNTLLQFPLQPAVKKQGLCASASLPAWLLLWKWTNWSAQAQHSHMEESTSPGRRRSLEGGRKWDLGKVEGRRMGEWWTLVSVLEQSIVLFFASTLFLPKQHLFIVILPSFIMVTGRCTRVWAVEELAAPTALTHTQSSESDIFQERIQLPVFPLGFPAPKWSRPPPLKYPSAPWLLTQLRCFCYQFTTPVMEEAQAFHLNSPSSRRYRPGVEEIKPGSGFDIIFLSDFGFQLK